MRRRPRQGLALLGIQVALVACGYASDRAPDHSVGTAHSEIQFLGSPPVPSPADCSALAYQVGSRLEVHTWVRPGSFVRMQASSAERQVERHAFRARGRAAVTEFVLPRVSSVTISVSSGSRRLVGMQNVKRSVAHLRVFDGDRVDCR
jgi:hypothetical protein